MANKNWTSKTTFKNPASTNGEQLADLMSAQFKSAKQWVSRDLNIDRLEPNPFQMRKFFDEEKIQELAKDIQQNGFFTRLLVRPVPNEERPGFYEIVFGERRLRAAKLAGVKFIPCDIAEFSNNEMIWINLTENLQREDLLPLEEARAFRIVLQHLHWTIDQLAEKLGVNKSYINDRLLILDVQNDVQRIADVNPDVPLRALREVAKLSSEEIRKPIVEALEKGQLTVENTRTIVSAVRSLPEIQPDVVREQVATFANERKVIEPILINYYQQQQQTAEKVYHDYAADFTNKIKPVLENWRKWLTESPEDMRRIVTYIAFIETELDKIKKLGNG